MTYDQDPYEGGRPVSRPTSGGRSRPPGRSGGDHTSAAIASGKYTEVKNRIQEFYAAYPTGRIVTRRVRELINVEGELIGWRVDALAYRTPEDTLPGTGTSYMAVPGTTPYTNGSELENAETSAWGRAVASVGIAIDKGIATAQEIRAKRGDDDEPPSIPAGPSNQLAAAAAEAAGRPEPVSMPAPGAPAPEPPAPVDDGPDAEPPGSAPVPAPEPPAPTDAPAEPEGKEDATESVPEDVDMVAEAERIFADVKADEGPGTGVTFEDFKRLTREHFIPNGLIATTARDMVEHNIIRQVGGVKELNDHERTLLLDELIKRSVTAK